MNWITPRSDVNTINSIVVQGDFPVNSISNEYTNLFTLEVPSDSFTSSINDELFKNIDLLKTVIIDGATSIWTSSFENCVQLETTISYRCDTVANKCVKWNAAVKQKLSQNSGQRLLMKLICLTLAILRQNTWNNNHLSSLEMNGYWW